MHLKIFLILFLTFQSIAAKTFLRLEPGTRFGKADELVSTLGQYKLTLRESDCSLGFYKFDKNIQNYTSLNKTYSGNVRGPCTHLLIVNNRLITNTLTVFLELSSSNLREAYFLIDDHAVLRFIGIKDASGVGPLDFQQIQYTNYSQPSQHVTILEGYSKVGDKLAGTSNNNNWIFQSNRVVLTITNPIYQISEDFSLPQLYFAITGIYNSDNQTFPSFNDGLLYHTVCSAQKNNLYGPFVLEVDQYFPKVTIYDQTKYVVFQYSVGHSQSNGNPCPRFTFVLNDKCVTTCPPPYLHQIRGQWGACVLSCEYGSVVDQRLKTCICENRINAITPSYNCVNSTSYYFGCYCPNNTFFDKGTYQCQQSCSDSMQPFIGICLACQKGCAQCSTVFNGLYYLICTKCITGFTLENGICNSITSCTPNCLQCSNNLCLVCNPFFTLQSGACKQQCRSGKVSTLPNLTSTCAPQPPAANATCNIDCLRCSSDATCIICQVGYALLVTPVSISCRNKNILFSCQSRRYASSANSNVCSSNDSSSLASLSKCINSIANCLVCHNRLSNICLLCRQGFALQQNKCVRQCEAAYTKVNQGCIRKTNFCDISSFQTGIYSSILAPQNIKSPLYLNYINNGLQLTNQPYGYTLYFMNLFNFKSDVTSINSKIGWARQVCAQCQKGYGLTADRAACVPCPPGCLLCLSASSCLASTKEQVVALTENKGLSGCLGFILEQQGCVQSCPTNTIPIMNETLQKVYCTTELSATTGYIKVDGSTYPISNNKYIHRFVFDSIISIKKARLLQDNALAIDASGNSITFQNNSPTQILNLSSILPNLISTNGQYPSNLIYGINQQTSFRSYIKKWLAGVGYVLSLIILIIHCVYVANSILYKMDNIIIFVQTVFYFLFTRIFISNPVAQYYYGFSWAHLNFFPNYFEPELNLSEPTVPPYALYNLDANVIRNAGSSLSLVLTFALVWGVVSGVVYLLDHRLGRKQLWYFRICKNSIICVIQLTSYNIFYWCMAFINYDKGYSNSGTFIGLSVLLLTILIIYIIGRAYFNQIAGLYMVKRLVYACVLASSYERTGYVGIIITMEGLFGVARSVIEKPRERWMLVSLWVEEGLIIVFLIILFTTTNASVVSILTTIFVYGWLLTFVADLSDLYFLSKNKYLEISCFKKLFQEEHQQFQSTSSKEETDRQISLNHKEQQK